MSASYPAAVWTPTVKTDKVDLVAAEHMNRAQEEIVALQTEIGADIAGSKATLLARLAVMINDAGVLQQGTSFPVSPIEGQMFYRTDEDALYIYDGSGWDNMLFVEDGAVTQAKLSTATGSQSGTVSGAPYFINITMHAYSFFPNPYYNGASLAAGNSMYPITTNNDDQIGRFAIWADGNDAYDVQWRYVNSSDQNHWIYGLKQDGVLISIWEAPDHPWVAELHPFGELKAGQEVVLFDDTEISKIKKDKIKCKDGRSLARYIFDNYIDDIETEFKKRMIVEEDIYDEKEGITIGIEKDGRKIKKMELVTLPYNIQFKTLKKKEQPL